MGWVGRLSGLPWSQSPEGLVEVLQRLADQPALRQQLSVEARHRYLTVFSPWCVASSVASVQQFGGKR